MKLDYKFKDKSLLELALTQSGVDAGRNNERLEFVGDRVLGLTVATMLYEMFPTEAEGELARRHSALVSTDTLASVADKLGLEGALRHGHLTAGRIRHVLANTMEAVIGAIYFDGGFEAARDFIRGIWHDLADADVHAPKDPKTTLQEYVQKHTGGELPVYKCVQRVGESHNPVFIISVSALGMTAEGTGPSKRTASTAAAIELVKKLAI